MPPLRRHLAIALCLAALVGGTWALEAAFVARLEARGVEARRDAAERAAESVAGSIAELQRDLAARARRVAAEPTVERALRDPAARDAAVEWFAELDLPEGTAVELYTPTPTLLAWAGPGLPLDAATRRLDFLDTLQAAVATDGAFREAVAVWQPVRAGGRVVGAVRVLRLVSVRVPVRNRYLRDFDLAATWARGLPASVAVSFGEEPPPARPGVVLHAAPALDGSTLAFVAATVPPATAVEAYVRGGYRDARAFFLALLGGWLVFGLVLLAGGALRAGPLITSRQARARAGLAVGGAAVGWWGLRYALLALDVPGRFFGGEQTPPALDPAYLGSGVLAGLAGSAVELIVTAAFAVGFGAGLLSGALTVLRVRRVRRRAGDGPVSPVRWTATAAAVAAAGVAGLAAAALLVHRATLDATLGFFDRIEPLADGLVTPVLGAFGLIGLGALLTLAALALTVGVRGAGRWLAGLGVTAGVLLAAYALTPLGDVLSPFVALGAFALAAGGAALLTHRPLRWTWLFTLRGAVGAALAAALLAYPIAFAAARQKEEARVRDAAEDFADGEDARVAYALESVLLDARSAEAVRAVLSTGLDAARADSVAAELVSGSLLAALADYTVALTLHAPDGDTLAHYRDEPPPGAEPAPTGADGLGFGELRRRFERSVAAGIVVEREPTAGRGGLYRYAGIGPVRPVPDSVAGWLTAHAEPKPARYVSETPFPRVLVPAGLYRLAEGEWAFAVFEGGVLTRPRGGSFGRLRLPATVRTLAPGESLWRTERVEGAPTRIYYRRLAEGVTIVAARGPATTLFDHLYFYLRLLLPMLVLAGLAYGAGEAVRRSGYAPAPPPRLRDRVLHRFFLVGLASIAVTGLVGRGAIVEQNREAVEDRLKRRLARVEDALYAEAGGAAALAAPERILDRGRPDVIGPRLGLDVNLYRGAELVASSRGQLVRQRLIERRLPIGVVEALFVRGERYAFATERIGGFTYTTGYEALPDARGHPAVVVAVPTLPEQIAIEAEQARMVAYLFGVLLLLLLVISVVARVLANQVTRPFQRLRDGLRAVGAGETPAEPLPVEVRDEVGEVVETFNAMRDQLEESRRKLAAQERELAWREMAQQVAHEIKNPLTPMKLSVQHLQQAFDRSGADGGSAVGAGDGAADGAGGGGAGGRFGRLFRDKTATLIEQIDALSRIAGEFSSFARLPDRHPERVDLSEVVRQAAALVAEEPNVEVVLALASEPLPVVADREELRRVYINLVKNAQQAIPAGERGTITVRTGRRPTPYGRVLAWSAVEDTGAGIPEAVRDRIFRPNFSTKTSGMGLGLAIARKAIEDSGGTIAFETTPGLGTTFTVALPLAE